MLLYRCYNISYFYCRKNGAVMNFAEFIRHIRKKTLYSQESFAKEIGVSFSTVNRWENGKSKPGYAALKQIKSFCEKNNITISYEE